MIVRHLPAKRVTNGPKHHFFGYFDKFPWDRSGRYLLTMETDFTARHPVPGDQARICMIDLQDDNALTVLAETNAWNWQQASMLQWLNDADTKIIYNDRDGDRFLARILDIETGEKSEVCRPIYCLSPDGRWAMSLNFSRLERERPGYGYPGAYDFSEHAPHPDNDGIYLVDLKANTARLVITEKQMVQLYYRSDMEPGPSWFNHMLFSPDSKRFAFFHRWRLYKPDGSPSWQKTHMFTAAIDGTDIWPLNLEDMSSHYTWTDDTHIINFSNRYRSGWNYYLYTDKSTHTEIVAKNDFPGDGHCSFSPDGKWMLTDSYPLGDHCRRLYLYDLTEKQAYEIGKFYADPAYPVVTRCDLHPNWSRDGRTITFDSIHEGSRQVYTMDVSPLTKP